MITEQDIDKWIDTARIPSDEEVEAAGRRFDRRIRRLRTRRRVLWCVSAAAAVMIPLFVGLYWLQEEPQNSALQVAEVVKTAPPITEPTLILSDGHSVNLNEKIADTAMRAERLHWETGHVKYDTLTGDTTSPVREIQYNTLVIPAGHTYAVTLADGTTVTLNAGTRLRYPVDFIGDTREVFLEGEAYFQVTKTGKPFEVHVSGSAVRVYGTSFNVKQQDSLVETVLVEGSIGFRSPGREEIRVSPGEQVTYDAVRKNIQVQEVDTYYATAWLDGVFRYSDKGLDAILKDLSAWYGVRFESRVDAAAIKLTMNLSKDTPVEEAVSFLESMTDCEIMKEKEVYIIKGKERN